MYDVIKFGKRSENFFELSPYYFCTYTVGGVKWRTLIHYWVASYFENSELQEVIRNLDTPEKVLYVGKRHGLSNLWQCNSKGILLPIQQRFNQCDGIRGILLATGGAQLIYSGDGFMAENNRYGRILMKLRDIYADK